MTEHILQCPACEGIQAIQSDKNAQEKQPYRGQSDKCNRQIILSRYQKKGMQWTLGEK